MSQKTQFQPEKARQARRKMQRISRRGRIVLVFLAILLVFVTSSYVKNLLALFLVDVMPTERTLAEDTLEGEFIILREELPLNAPFTGRLEVVKNEGERVAKDTALSYLLAQGGSALEKNRRQPIVAPLAGVVSYFTDGYEKICNPKTWPQLDLDHVEELAQRLGDVPLGDARKKDMIQGGSPLGKIIDNLSPMYLYSEVSQDFPRQLTTGQIMELRLANMPELLIRGQIVEVREKGAKIQLLLRIPNLPELYHLRKIEGTVIVQKYRGIKIAEHLLVKREDIPGVYIVAKGRASWREVEIVANLQKKVVIEGIEPGTWIVMTPQLVQEGQRVVSSPWPLKAPK